MPQAAGETKRPGVFRFKQFAVRHDECAFKVTSDAAIFGSVVAASVKKHRRLNRVLDIGAGSGLLTLMLAQASSQAYLDAIEIDTKSSVQCQVNFESSPWSERLNLLNMKAQDFRPQCPYDLMIANPPFYHLNKGAPRPLDYRQSRARHGEELSLEDLAEIADRCLHEDHGECWLLLPRSEHEYFRDQLAHDHKLCLTQTLALRGLVTKHPHLIISQYSRLSRTAFLSDYYCCEEKDSKSSTVTLSKEEDYNSEEVITIWQDPATVQYHHTFEEYLREYYIRF